MNAQIENTEYGYIVGIYYDFERKGTPRWYRLRNFGTRQGDAKDFRDNDLPKLTDPQIRLLIKNFLINRKYVRIDGRHFKVQKD